MTVKVQMANGGSDSVDFVNAAGTTLAQVKGYDDTSSNGHLEFYTTASGTSTEQMRITSAGNVGIGTSSPVTKLTMAGNIAFSGNQGLNWNMYPDVGDKYIANGYAAQFYYNPSAGMLRYLNASNNVSGAGAAASLVDRLAIDSNGILLVNNTTADTNYWVKIAGTGAARSPLKCQITDTTSTATQIGFANPNGVVGSITTNGSSTSYGTSSDYRLKENVQPMTGALSVVAQLKPVTYSWKLDGSDGQGFIAHELQEVVPDCVIGEKDAVDSEGNPVYQGIDTSFLVATLTAAIKEQQAIIQTLTERITALENKQ